MEEGTVSRAAKEIERGIDTYEIQSRYRVEPIEPVEKHTVETATENEAPKNIHPTLGKNIDIIA